MNRRYVSHCRQVVAELFEPIRVRRDQNDVCVGDDCGSDGFPIRDPGIDHDDMALTAEHRRLVDRHRQRRLVTLIIHGIGIGRRAGRVEHDPRLERERERCPRPRVGARPMPPSHVANPLRIDDRRSTPCLQLLSLQSGERATIARLLTANACTQEKSNRIGRDP
ncbi:hypothetical protein [Salinarimonas sp.]|uniref:hypothetical protein n=1 Tax=Salinarimonas sp. TaxID=2766526 RepID=UPI00391B18BE